MYVRGDQRELLKVEPYFQVCCSTRYQQPSTGFVNSFPQTNIQYNSQRPPYIQGTQQIRGPKNIRTTQGQNSRPGEPFYGNPNAQCQALTSFFPDPNFTCCGREATDAERTIGKSFFYNFNKYILQTSYALSIIIFYKKIIKESLSNLIKNILIFFHFNLLLQQRSFKSIMENRKTELHRSVGINAKFLLIGFFTLFCVFCKYFNVYCVISTGKPGFASNSNQRPSRNSRLQSPNAPIWINKQQWPRQNTNFAPPRYTRSVQSAPVTFDNRISGIMFN